MMAQPPPEPPPIIVTGRGLETPPGEAVFDVVEIGRDRLAGSASNRLEDVLRDAAGFQLFRRSDARSANPTSQGATLRALGGNASSRALLTLDGVPQTDPFGGWVFWPAYDPRRLGRVRVVRGGGSGTAGPGALAGTIELESASPADAEGLNASLAYGSRDSVDAFAGIGLRLGAGFVQASVAHASGDGFIPVVARQRGAADRPAPYDQSSLALRAAVPVGHDTELQAGALLFHDGRERGTAYSEIATDGADASLRLVGSGRWGWSALGYVQARDFYNGFASVAANRATATRTSEQYDVPAQGLGARVEVRPPLKGVQLRLGADLRETRGVTRERYSFQNGIGTRGRVAGGRTLTTGAFAEASAEPGPFVLTLGGRVDHWWITDGRLQERQFAGDVPLTNLGFLDRTGWEPTARGGVAWKIAGPLTVRAAAYLGWRLPTLNELYRPFRAGTDATAPNPALDPERLRGAEAGLEWRPAQGARVAVTAFANRLEGAIANVTLGAGPGTFPIVGTVAAGGAYRQRQNLGAVDSRGVEVDAGLSRGPWSVNLSYSFADAEVSANGAALPLNGLRPAQTPRHSASATLAWSRPDGTAGSLALRYAGHQFEDDLNRQPIPEALTVDAALAWPVTRRIAIEVRAENLADEEVVAGISGEDIIERASPRTLWIGLRLRG